MSTSLQIFNSKVVVDNYNNDFLLLRAKPITSTGAIGKAIFQKQFDFVEEVIVTEVEICLKLNANFDPTKIEYLKDLQSSKTTEYKTYKLPVYFDDSEDWTTVESVTNLSKEVIISKLIATDFSIAMLGFLPGFIYLKGLDQALHVPRKTVPAKYVKANSIAIGGKYLGLYALDSPGGWQVIGHMPLSILQIPKLPPLVLNLGDKLKIQAIDKAKYEQLLQHPISLNAYNA